jgi:hypothetical protein
MCQTPLLGASLEMGIDSHAQLNQHKHQDSGQFDEYCSDCPFDPPELAASPFCQSMGLTGQILHQFCLGATGDLVKVFFQPT